VQEEGVNVIANAEVENVEKVEDQLILSLNNGRKVIMIQTFIIKYYLKWHMHEVSSAALTYFVHTAWKIMQSHISHTRSSFATPHIVTDPPI